MEIQFMVPTYNANLYPKAVAAERMAEYGEPLARIAICPAEGLRIVLENPHDDNKRDVQIERQPNGWVIFLHPLVGCDACGYVYFLDDGRVFLHKERYVPTTEPIEVLEADETLLEIHGDCA